MGGSIHQNQGRLPKKNPTNLGFWLNLRWHLPTFGTWAPLTGARGGDHNWKMFFIAFFRVLDDLDQFKAIKENLLRGVEQKAQVCSSFFWKASLIIEVCLSSWDVSDQLTNFYISIIFILIFRLSSLLQLLIFYFIFIFRVVFIFGLISIFDVVNFAASKME